MPNNFIRFYQYTLSLEDSVEYSKFCIQSSVRITEELRSCEKISLWRSRGYEDHFSDAQLNGYLVDFKIKDKS